ncbi:MAG TPA: exonuclease SbcCD subunit D [Deinococcales bacterium]|nr:exonuclease SbcCD subunit D [Deinococcales bacterium]
MRVLHTGDWHVGRNLKGRDRTGEIGRALEEILAMLRTEGAQLLLVAGDVFDSPNPSAEAESVVYEFFRQVGELGVPSVIIAGNHDSPARLEGISGLLKRVNAHATGRVRTAQEGGVLRFQVGSEAAMVGALPFLSERRLVKAAQLLGEDVSAWRRTYQEGMNFFTGSLAKGFQADTVNLLMLHATLEGAKPSGSEHQFYLTGSYTVDPAHLPSGAQYVAVGHLHRNQQLRDIPPVHYSGSVVQLDFGEAGEEKVVKLIEVSPRRPARVHDLPLTLESPLKVVRASLANLPRALDAEKGFPGFIKAVVRLDTPQPYLKDRILGEYPNVLALEAELPDVDVTSARKLDVDLSPLEAYLAYYRERWNATPDDSVVNAFRELYRETQGEDLPDARPDALPDEPVALKPKPRRARTATSGNRRETPAPEPAGLDAEDEGLGLEEVDVQL